MNDDFADHIGVRLAEIIEGAGFGEGEVKTLPGVQRAAVKRFVVAGNGVYDGVLVYPGDGDPDGDVKRRRDVLEIRNQDGVG